MPRFDRLELDPLPGGPRPPDGHGEADRDEKYWLRKADENQRSGSYESALRFYSRALERDKSLITGWLGQVRMLIALEEFPEADLWARKALELFRNQPDLMAGRAQALGRDGDRKKALELCDGALRQEGQSAYRWLVRGELMIELRDGVDRHCFDKAIQLDPDWLVPLEIALAYRYHDLPSHAQLRALQAVEKAPQSAYAWYVKGCCELDMDLIRQGQESLARCLELTPRHAEAEKRLVELANRGWSWRAALRKFFHRT